MLGPPGGRGGFRSPPEHPYTVQIPPGAYQRTLARRVKTWGLKYPEWHMFIFGSKYDGKPGSNPTGFNFILQLSVATAGQKWYDIISDKLFQVLNERGYKLTPSVRGYQVRQPAGAAGGIGGRYAPYLTDINVSLSDLLG
jgi:hypothetical protein